MSNIPSTLLGKKKKEVTKKYPPEFIILIRTSNTSVGSSANNQFSIPSTSTGYTVDWGDSTVETIAAANPVHTYAAPGDYEVRISPNIGNFSFNNTGDRLKLLAVENWGDITISGTNWAFAFFGCTNMVFDLEPDNVPAIAPGANIAEMFRTCTSFNGPIRNWNAANLSGINGLFRNANSFQENLNHWDVSNVVLANFVFSFHPFYNQPVNNLDFTSIVNLTQPFRVFSTSAFNQPLDKWDTSLKSNFDFWFFNASSFNQDLSSWQIRSSSHSMASMLNNTNMSTRNYNRLLISFANQTFANSGPYNVPLDASNLTYDDTVYEDLPGEFNNAVDARAYLTGGTANWTITDSGVLPTIESLNPLFDYDCNKADVDGFTGTIFNQGSLGSTYDLDCTNVRMLPSPWGQSAAKRLNGSVAKVIEPWNIPSEGVTIAMLCSLEQNARHFSTADPAGSTSPLNIAHSFTGGAVTFVANTNTTIGNVGASSGNWYLVAIQCPGATSGSTTSIIKNVATTTVARTWDSSQEGIWLFNREGESFGAGTGRIQRVVVFPGDVSAAQAIAILSHVYDLCATAEFPFSDANWS
jgi:hypothetical protein